MLTESQLQQIVPRLQPPKLALYLPHLNRAMQRHGVDTMLRTAAFVAQLAHESSEFRFMEEIWGPIPAQLRYEPPSSLAARLGNTEPGDGQRFKGRGPIQITGRFNYRKYGELLDIDLVAAPERAAAPELAFETAGMFWRSNGLNELADAQDFVAMTRRINGGVNGLEDRQRYYARAKVVLAVGFVAAAGATRGANRAAPRATAPLSRGHEDIIADPGE
jgi:predicted chitinase